MRLAVGSDVVYEELAEGGQASGIGVCFEFANRNLLRDARQHVELAGKEGWLIGIVGPGVGYEPHQGGSS